MKREILKIVNLSLSFSTMGEKMTAVENASLSLYKNETLAIVGESGCGKSALVKAIMGLNPPEITHTTSGEIWFQQKNLLTLKEPELRKYRGHEIGMIFQDPMASLNPTMKVGKQIEESFVLYHPKTTSKQIYEEIIERLHLVGISQPEKVYHLYPFELSGGMRQRIMIAISLAANPKILIADEPTTALDVTIQAQILHQLMQIQKKLGMSIIFITHNLALVAGFCSRIAVMYGGHIVESALTETLFENPKHPYTKKLLASIPRIDQNKEEKLTPISGHPPSPLEKVHGCPFHPRCQFTTDLCMTTNPELTMLGDSLVACHHPHQKQAPRMPLKVGKSNE